MISATRDPVHEEVIILDVEPAETNFSTLLTAASLFQRFGDTFNVEAICCGLVAPHGRIWNNHYLPGEFVEEAVVMPPSTFTFIITVLLAFVEIKSQGNPEFPFQTHSHAIIVSVTSLLVYGLASAIEHVVIYGAGLDPTSDCAMIARLGRIGSLCILVGSLASLFYF